MHSLRLTDDSQTRRSRLHPGNLAAASSRATAALQPDNGTRTCPPQAMRRWSAPPPFDTSTNPAIVEPSNKTLRDDMDDEKSVLAQMTEAVSNAAGATKEAAKTAVKKVKKTARKVAKKVTPNKAKKAKKASKKSSAKKSAKKAGKKAAKKKKKARKSRR